MIDIDGIVELYFLAQNSVARILHLESAFVEDRNPIDCMNDIKSKFQRYDVDLQFGFDRVHISPKHRTNSAVCGVARTTLICIRVASCAMQQD